jgi:hypothetical protein
VVAMPFGQTVTEEIQQGMNVVIVIKDFQLKIVRLFCNLLYIIFV